MARRIVGLEAFKKKMKELPKAAEAEIRLAMEKSADEIVAMMKSLVPVDAGDLRDSIGWTWGDKPKYSQAFVKTTQGGMTLTIFAGNSKVRYAHIVEFGAQHMAAHPFFFSSFRFLQKRAKSRITRAINKAAKKVTNGQ